MWVTAGPNPVYTAVPGRSGAPAAGQTELHGRVEAGSSISKHSSRSETGVYGSSMPPLSLATFSDRGFCVLQQLAGEEAGSTAGAADASRASYQGSGHQPGRTMERAIRVNQIKCTFYGRKRAFVGLPCRPFDLQFAPTVRHKCMLRGASVFVSGAYAGCAQQCGNGAQWMKPSPVGATRRRGLG